MINTDKDKVVRRLLNEKCESCGDNLAEDEHNCPYKEEINNDDTSLCNCCSKCTEDCAGDI